MQVTSIADAAVPAASSSARSHRPQLRAEPNPKGLQATPADAGVNQLGTDLILSVSRWRSWRRC